MGNNYVLFSYGSHLKALLRTGHGRNTRSSHPTMMGVIVIVVHISQQLSLWSLLGHLQAYAGHKLNVSIIMPCDGVASTESERQRGEPPLPLFASKGCGISFSFARVREGFLGEDRSRLSGESTE